jgi:hypothetical protein
MDEFQLRTEHSRSLEDAERLKALQTLTELGQLIPLGELDVHHGRVGDDNEAWLVDPTLKDGGNNNVNQRTTLYTGDHSTAAAFAGARHRELAAHDNQTTKQAELYKIASDDIEARVLNLSFNYASLTSEEQQRYRDAMRGLRISLSDGSPLDFKYRGHNQHMRDVLVQEAAAQGRETVIGETDVQNVLARSRGVDEASLRRLAGSYNALQLTASSLGFLGGRLISHAQDLITSEVTNPHDPNETWKIPVNLEWTAQFFRQAHIVGVKHRVNSATLGRTIDVVSIFDLEKVNDPDYYEWYRYSVGNMLADFVDLRMVPERQTDRPGIVRELVENPYAKPERLVELAAEVPGFQRLFELDTGVWEGFTLGQHTETALRNFDENYADKLPVSLLAPMRLAILVHDLGKPVARQRAGDQKQYNAAYASSFMQALNIPAPTQKLVLSLIGQGNVEAYKALIQKKNFDDPDWDKFAAREAQDIFGPAADIDYYTVKGYKLLSKIMLICDGGAYTSMAVTRHPDGTYYRNAASFNASFRQPHDLASRRIVLTHEKHAADTTVPL